MPTPDAARRLLLVHAHPDDETIGTGATMARYVADGAHVTLVTCTLGELGEIVVPELEHLAADREDRLGEHRIGELAAAMSALGVTDHRFLGGTGRYRDSGMAWGTGPDGRGQRAVPMDDIDPNSFWAADLREASDQLVEVIREVQPQVVVTYDEHGGYGHPDHIQAHRVAMYASALAGVPSYRLDLGEPWDVPKIYWTAMPRSVIQQGIDAAKANGDDSVFEGLDSADDFGFVVDDDHIDAAVDGGDYVKKKMDAMRAHASQIDMTNGFFAMTDADGAAAGLWGIEYYRLARGVRGPSDPDTGRESDLFAGV